MSLVVLTGGILCHRGKGNLITDSGVREEVRCRLEVWEDVECPVGFLGDWTGRKENKGYGKYKGEERERQYARVCVCVVVVGRWRGKRYDVRSGE